MMVIRPVELTDLDDITELAAKTGSGLTTLPNSRDHLEAKIQDSINAFNKTDGKA